MKPKVLFIGTTVYSNSLNQTYRKKFKYLNKIADIFEIAFIKGKTPKVFNYENVKFYLVPHEVSLRILWYFFLAFFFASYLVIKKEINIIVFQSSIEGILIFPLKLLSFLLKKKICFVVESHSNLEEAYVYIKNINTLFFRNLIKKMIKNITSIVVKKADVLRAVSKETEKTFSKISNEKKIIVFPAWTDIEVFYYEGNKKSNKENQILFVGSIAKVKGIHYLIEAFAKIEKSFPNVKLLIVGWILDHNYYEFLIKLIESYKIAEKVKFLSYLLQKDLAKLMKKSLVIILPSESEGLGRVLIEALATGTPVIGSNVGGIPDIIDDGVDGFLFGKGNIEELAEKIKFFLEDMSRSYIFGEKGRQKVLKLFSPEKYVGGYKRIFEVCMRKINGTS